MDRARFEELASRWVMGEPLTTDEEDELARALATQPELRAELLDDQRVEGALAAMGRTAADGERFARQFEQRVAAESDARRFVTAVESRLQRPRWSRLLGWPALGIALGAAVGALLVWRTPEQARPAAVTEPQRAAALPGKQATTVDRPRAAAKIVRTHGRVFAMASGARVPAQEGLMLQPGHGVMTVGRDSHAALEYLDGTRVELGADTAVGQVAAESSSQGKAMFLARGWLRAEVVRQPTKRPFVVLTPQAEVLAMGSRFTVDAGDDGTRVDVSQGAVRVAKHDEPGGREVAAGQFGLALDRQDVSVISRPRGGVLFVTGRLEPDPADAVLKEHLEKMGFDVTIQGAGAPRESDIARVVMVVISSTVSSLDVNTYYRNLPVPLLTWEAWLYDDLGLTGVAKEWGEADATRGSDLYAEVVIKDRGHPLAAGRDGTVAVSRVPGKMTYGRPSPAASWVATLPGHPTKAAIFAYDKGTPMVGLAAAPARRVGFFLWDETATKLSADGWALFEAAVLWCAEGGRQP